MIKFALLGNCFSNVFIEVEIGYSRVSSLFEDVFQKNKVKFSLNMTVFNNWWC